MDAVDRTIRAYFEDEILADSVAQTIQNIAAFEWILQKTGVVLLIFLIPDRRNADGMGRSRSATGSRFVRMSAYIWGMFYLNAMGDDANSYLYYELVHLSGSLFPAISATKWSAFLVNAVALVAVLLLLYGIAGYFTAVQKDNFWCACCSGARWAAWI